jgi:tetratricopeptide (TPR) repeat protein
VSFLNLFSGPDPDKLEDKGDAYLASRLWGQAKQFYERALHKLEQLPRSDENQRRRLEDKIRQTRRSLARDHQQTALVYLEGGYPEEARETFQLAMDISPDPAVRKELAQQLSGLVQHTDSGEIPHDETEDHTLPREDHATFPAAGTTNEHFRALCHTLPEEVGRAYRQYGPDFMEGYVALNKGDFEMAIAFLEKALTTMPQPESYIPLELATAYFHQGRLEEARDLLEQVRLHHPEALPAYQLLCEIYWEQGATAQAEALLASLPPHLARSRAVMLLKGKTLFRAGRFEEARDFYQDTIHAFGWHDPMALELARTHEALYEVKAARTLYGQLMERCRGCGSRSDPRVTHKYAELSFADGLRGSDLIELYLELTQEVPNEAALYFHRISQIYFHRGNMVEGERFRQFASRALRDTDLSPRR